MNSQWGASQWPVMWADFSQSGNITLTPAAAALALSAVTSTLKTTLRPATGTLTLAGQTSIVARTLKPATGTLTLSAQTSALKTTLHPATAALSLSAINSTLKFALHPAAASLSLTGQTSQVVSAVVLHPVAGILILVGGNSTLRSSHGAGLPGLAVSAQRLADVANYTLALETLVAKRNSMSAITVSGYNTFPALVAPSQVLTSISGGSVRMGDALQATVSGLP